MSSTNVSLKRPAFGSTMRPGVWWLQPLLVFLGLSAFVAYSTWAAFQGNHYRFGVHSDPLTRRVESDVVHERSNRPGFIRHRLRHHRADRECRFAWRIHV